MPLLFLVLLVMPLSAEDSASTRLARLTPVPPCSTLAAAARTNLIPLEGIDPPTGPDVLTPGDSMTAVITLFQKNDRRTQWLMYLQAVTPTPKEQSAKPPEPLIIYAHTGNKLKFAPSSAFVTLRMLGPFAEPGRNRKSPQPQDKSTRFGLNQGFLALGLDKAAAVVLRIKESKSKGSFAFRSTPFTDAELVQGRKFAADLQLTPEEERALGGSSPAMFSYFDVVQQTPDLEGIMLKVVDLPSVWSFLWHAGVKVNMAFLPQGIAKSDATAWGLPPTASLYHFPLRFELNDHPALNITLVVTAPHPPLLSCAGIVGVLAEKPDDKETYLTFQVLSAKRASTK